MCIYFLAPSSFKYLKIHKEIFLNFQGYLQKNIDVRFRNLGTQKCSTVGFIKDQKHKYNHNTI